MRIEPEDDFGPTRLPIHFRWMDAQFNVGRSMATDKPDGGYYSLMIYPKEDPASNDGCIPNIEATGDRRGRGASWFIPLNDAQWTTPSQGYGFALRATGRTAYLDISSHDPLAGTDLAGLKGLFQLTGSSVWAVLAGRTMEEILGE